MPKRELSPSSPLPLPHLAKRRRTLHPASSCPPSLAHAPLTYERLALHNQLVANQPLPISISVPMYTSMPPPTSSTTGAALSRSASLSKASEHKVRDNEDKLRDYRIYIRSHQEIPVDLQAFIDELKGGDGIDTVRSPNARHVAQRQQQAQYLSEQDGIDLLRGVLLFVEDDSLPMLAVKSKQNLDKRYLPPPRDSAWIKDYGPLESPQPDHLFGYRHSKESNSTTTAFSEEQEYSLFSRAVAQGLHFPFMSAQWKSPKNNQTHFQARLQGARDGAVIVRYLHQFYTNAGIVPATLDTAHFSLTIDMESAHLFIHWQEFDQECPAYYMKPVMKAFLDNEQQVADMRHMMKNILAYAMGSRLAKLRSVVETTQAHQVERSVPLSKSSSLNSAINLPPPSPQSLGDGLSHPSKKRPRTSSRTSSNST